jgi:phage gp45-like
MDDIVDLLKKLTSHVSNGIRVCMPATIETYDFLTQQASVKIDMQELYEDGETIDYPVVSGVPVVFMASGGASITMPVNRGDYCMLIYADRDMSNWLLGGTGQKPDSMRMHNLSDAIAIMGLFPFTSSARAENNTDVLITYSGSKIILKPNGIINIETTKDVNVQAAETINITSKDANVNIVDTVNINSKQLNVTTTNDVAINCKNANITATEDVAVNCKNANITATEDATLTSNNIIINAATNVDIICENANIVASSALNSKSPTFTHTGNMRITGNLELEGAASGKNEAALTVNGGITSTGGVIKSNAVTLDTHTHSYSAPVVGSSPTAAVPATTGTPI